MERGKPTASGTNTTLFVKLLEEKTKQQTCVERIYGYSTLCDGMLNTISALYYTLHLEKKFCYLNLK